jgi:hypothetical protein
VAPVLHPSVIDDGQIRQIRHGLRRSPSGDREPELHAEHGQPTDPPLSGLSEGYEGGSQDGLIALDYQRAGRKDAHGDLDGVRPT